MYLEESKGERPYIYLATPYLEGERINCLRSTIEAAAMRVVLAEDDRDARTKQIDGSIGAILDIPQVTFDISNDRRHIESVGLPLLLLDLDPRSSVEAIQAFIGRIIQSANV